MVPRLAAWWPTLEGDERPCGCPGRGINKRVNVTLVCSFKKTWPAAGFTRLAAELNCQ